MITKSESAIHVGTIQNKLSIVTLLLLLVAINILGQDNLNTSSRYSLTGIVRDAKTKMPIVGAQLQTITQKAAAITNDSGRFEMSLLSLEDVLSVKAYNYGVREVAIQGIEFLEIDLYSDIFSTSYRTVESLTGKVSNTLITSGTKNVENIENTSYFTVDDAIQTQLGGDVRTQRRSGFLDVGTTMFIRGYNSLNLNAQPLFIVDGVIWNSLYNVESIHAGFFSNPLALIDMDDIESISVVKDGTSIYGSKASNGVVIIKTKRGEGVVTKITANAMLGVTTKPETLPILGADDYRILFTELLGSSSSDYDISRFEEVLDDNPVRSYYNLYHNNTDWFDGVYQNSITQTYSISVNGGDDKALYAFSVGYANNRGTIKNTGLERINTRFNSDIKLTNNLNLGLNVSFSNIYRDLLDDGINFYTSPTYLSYIKSPFLNPRAFTKAGAKTVDIADSDIFGVGNPIGIIENSVNTNKHYRFNLGVLPSFNVLPGLNVSNNFNYSLDKSIEFYFRPMDSSAPIRMQDNGETIYSLNEVKNQVMRNTSIFNDFRVNYSKEINRMHFLNMNIGWRYLNDYYEMDYMRGHNTGSNNNINFRDDLTARYVTGINDRSKTISNYASVDYSFKNKYLLNVTASMDASSKFGKETKGGVKMFGQSWGVFPSVNAAWLASSEPFMSSVGIINKFKIKGGYGVTGNDDLSAYASFPYFISTHYIDRTVGIIIGNIANPEIQWETTKRLNAGMDLNILNERLALSIDVYRSNTTNLLALKTFPEETGLDSYWSNEGEISNQGFEISANLKVLNLSLVKWELGLNIGSYKNEIVALPDEDYTTSIYGAEVLTSVGNPAGLFYGYKTNGVFSTTEDAKNAWIDENSIPVGLHMVNEYGNDLYFGAGDMYFQDLARPGDPDLDEPAIVQEPDGIIDENDRVVIGDPNPDFYGSFSSKISIKNFTLDAYFTYSFGNDIYNALRAKLESGGSVVDAQSIYAWNRFLVDNQSVKVLNRWRTEGQITDQPKSTYGDPMGNARFSDRWIEDGSYIKLKSVTLSYKLPLKNSFVDGLTLWASANNLFTLTKYLGIDPEVSVGNSVLYQGIDIGLLPNTRSYFFGVKLNL